MDLIALSLSGPLFGRYLASTFSAIIVDLKLPYCFVQPMTWKNLTIFTIIIRHCLRLFQLRKALEENEQSHIPMNVENKKGSTEKA